MGLLEVDIAEYCMDSRSNTVIQYIMYGCSTPADIGCQYSTLYYMYVRCTTTNDPSRAQRETGLSYYRGMIWREVSREGRRGERGN